MKKIIQWSFVIASFVIGNGISFADDGQSVYAQSCQTCHATSMAQMLKAPASQNEADWKPFILSAMADAAKNKTTHCSSTLDYEKLTVAEKACYLLPIAKSGKTTSDAAMPPYGNCTNCSDAQLEKAIEYMLNH